MFSVLLCPIRLCPIRLCPIGTAQFDNTDTGHPDLGPAALRRPGATGIRDLRKVRRGFGRLPNRVFAA
jgi:hypothetical protein